jgi:RNA polymerase sigma-70 factor (ECF subfamily)
MALVVFVVLDFCYNTLMEDADLIDKILSRDKRALHVFYHTYTPKLSRFIGGKVKNPRDAEEILQDTLFAFLEALRDFHGSCKISTFLFSIGKHKIIDYYRKKKLKHLVFSQVPYLEELVSPIFNPEEELDVVMLKEKLHRVFSLILPKYKTVLLLKYVDDCSVLEIARRCAWTLKGTESLLFRARKAFIREFLVL